MAVETTPKDLPLASLKQELIDSLPEDKEWVNSDTCVVGNLMFLTIEAAYIHEPPAVGDPNPDHPEWGDYLGLDWRNLTLERAPLPQTGGGFVFGLWYGAVYAVEEGPQAYREKLSFGYAWLGLPVGDVSTWDQISIVGNFTLHVYEHHEEPTGYTSDMLKADLTSIYNSIG